MRILVENLGKGQRATTGKKSQHNKHAVSHREIGQVQGMDKIENYCQTGPLPDFHKLSVHCMLHYIQFELKTAYIQMPRYLDLCFYTRPLLFRKLASGNP